MQRVISTKLQTSGLSTDKFSGKNCHVYLGEMWEKLNGSWSAIATDLGSTLPNGMKLSVVDINLTLLNEDRRGSGQFASQADDSQNQR
jgi:hypothetical protein